MRKLTPEQREALLTAYLAGVPAAALARQYGVRPEYARTLAQRRGVGRGGYGRRPRPRTALPPQQRRGEPDPITDDTIARVTWLHKVQGLSSLRIAPLVRLPYREVERIIGAG